MTIDPLNILSKRISFGSLVLFALLTLYVVFLAIVFVHWVNPSFAKNTTNEQFAVDSTVYMDIADSIREGSDTPYVMASIFSFPNTALTPVAISLLLKNGFLILVFNCLVFFISLFLFNKTFSLSFGVFVFLLLINPTTTTSLLCLNKEIIDLLVISLFLYALRNHYSGLRIAALVIALFNRYEICVVMLAFIFARSKLNPLRKYRTATLLILISILTLAMPFFGSKVLATRFEEARFGGAVTALDAMQMHYLYIVAVIPKIAENLFGQLVNSAFWNVAGGGKADNAHWLSIMFFNNVANAIIVFVLAINRMLTLKNDLIYFGALGAVLVAQSLAIQPRYFYFLYVLLCLQATLSYSLPNERFFLLTRNDATISNA